MIERAKIFLRSLFLSPCFAFDFVELLLQKDLLGITFGDCFVHKEIYLLWRINLTSETNISTITSVK